MNKTIGRLDLVTEFVERQSVQHLKDAPNAISNIMDMVANEFRTDPEALEQIEVTKQLCLHSLPDIESGNFDCLVGRGPTESQIEAYCAMNYLKAYLQPIDRPPPGEFDIAWDPRRKAAGMPVYHTNLLSFASTFVKDPKDMPGWASTRVVINLLDNIAADFEGIDDATNKIVETKHVCRRYLMDPDIHDMLNLIDPNAEDQKTKALRLLKELDTLLTYIRPEPRDKD